MNTPARARLIRLVHVGRRELALDDDTYRALVADVAGDDGRTSCTQLKDKELQVLVDRMKGTGFKVVSKRDHGRRPNPPATREQLIKKLEAQLAEAGRPWAYADGMARRICKVDKVDWCTDEQLHKLIAAMYMDATRHKRKAR